MTERADTYAGVPPLAGLLKVAGSDSKLRGVSASLDAPALHLSGIDQARSWTVGTIAQRAPVLLVTATGREAEDLTAELRAMLGERVAYFPSWETLPHERLSPSVDAVGRRAEVLARAHDLAVVVTAARGFCQPLLRDVPGREPISLRVGEDQDFSQLTEALVFRGYKHVDMVARHGEFATRGGLIDVFPTTSSYPVRIEFWGDEVTDIRQFSVADQRALPDMDLPDVALYPARELPITEDVAQRAAQLAVTYPGNPTLVELLARLSERSFADGMEALIPVLSASPLITLAEFLPPGTHVVLVAPEKIRRRIEDLARTDAEFMEAGWEAAAMGATAPLAAQGLDLSASAYRSLESLEISAREAGQKWWTFSAPGMFEADDAATLELDYAAGPAPRGDVAAIAGMMSQLKKHTADGGRAAYIAPTEAAIKRMRERFLEQGIPASVAAPGAAPEPGEVTLYQALSHGGLVFPRPRAASANAKSEERSAAPTGGSSADVLPLVVITETDLTGNRVGDIAGAKRRPARRRNRVDPLALQPGDFVVHETHGIGRFLKMAERTMRTGGESSRREYIVLEYAPSKRGQPNDTLWVPMESLDLLSKYSGSDAPGLSKMGGSDWKNTKRKARAAVREIASELVELYAKRQSAPGHAFAPDNVWQREMEDNFPYVETEDQLNVIEAVKADMERPVPMDRVVIGDVGYGKTEVAVRAAFKAVQGGKQVAVLVPTTLLAQQHLATLLERMDGFGVNVRGLSRFTSASESKEILAGMADGSVDVVVGTHRLLATGVQWKALGLIIVDEEQRFGVEHKEQLKAIKSDVDVLTMSATPIPRTLEMSLAGIREMSTILTPPEDRHPVLTYVGPQEDKQVAAAIRRELLRDGQVFYVHNKVADIEQRARAVRDLVPEARVVVAHGQMSEEQLEQTVQGFWDREYDVLLCTTIVETGLDIANANTLIVENAHHMGLSQLHQLRGRVGRSRERAYAYFLYPKGITLTEASYDRLATIAQNNELGAGMAVAQKDLEMRGAGNVLGSQQSGHIAGVGFDLYVRLVGEAVETFRALAEGKLVDVSEQEPQEIRVDLPVDAHIPEHYVNAERLRLEGYRRIAEAKTEEDLRGLVEELKDRFGPLPREVERLLALARLRRVARAAGVSDISVVNTRVKIHPLELSESRQVRLRRLYPGSTYRAVAKAVQVPMPREGRTLTSPLVRDIELVQWVADFLAQMCEVEAVDVSGRSGGESATPRGKENGTRFKDATARGKENGTRFKDATARGKENGTRSKDATARGKDATSDTRGPATSRGNRSTGAPGPVTARRGVVSVARDELDDEPETGRLSARERAQRRRQRRRERLGDI